MSGMGLRISILVAAVTAALLGSSAAPAAAVSEKSGAANAVSGRMLSAPRVEALVTRLPVRVVVRVPARTSRLRVRVGGRNVTARFRRTRGSRRVARLTRGDGLRYGRNHLSVLAERRGRRPVTEARSFILARRQNGLARLRVRPGPVTSLNVRVAGRAALGPEHFGRPGEVDRRLAVIRRERTVRLWLNGRRITRAVDRSQVTRWTAKLSAGDGLRHGVNRLRMLVAEPDRGRYELLRRRFVVRRDRHLAAAGSDTSIRLRGRVRFDGRRSRAAGGGRVDHDWSILSKPRGSRAKLSGAGTARPALTPDRRGRYVLGLTVSGRAKRATASQATRSSADTVTLTAYGPPLLVPFTGLTVKDGHPGIQVNDTFFPNPSPNGAAMQWLTLDRATLTPTKTGNTWLDGTGSGDHGIEVLTDALAPQDPAKPDDPNKVGVDQLVILAHPYAGGPGPPVQPDQYAAFNDALKLLGVGRLDTAILQDHNKLVIVGVPYGGDGSGWYTHGGGPVDGLTGSLMPDVKLSGSGAFNFRFQPDRPAFDTSAKSTQSTNTMSIRGDERTASFDAGVTGGFQVVQFTPIDLQVVRSDAYGSNGSWDGLGPMVTRLNEIYAAGDAVAVQSIGHPTPSSSTWPQVAMALAGFGANPQTFNTVDGAYAFVGGRQLARTEVAESSSAVVIDPTTSPATREPGTLRGRMSMRGDGFWTPTIADVTRSLESSLYDVVFRPPTPWAYTTGGAFPQQRNCAAPGGDTAAYAAALSFVATGIGLTAPAYKSDLRSAYVLRNQKDDWSDQKSDLAGLQFMSGQGFGEAEFCNLKAELQQEFDWLDNVKGLFDSYEDALNRSAAVQSVNLGSIGDKILKLVAPADNSTVDWSIGGFLGNLGSAGILGVNPDATAVLAAWEALVTAYELVRELASDAGGAPQGDEVSKRAKLLAADVSDRLFDTANGLDRLRQVIISDYGRLNALGSVANNPGWAIDPGDTATRLTAGANAFFSSELLPVASDVWYPKKVNPSRPGVVTADNCWIQYYGWPFKGATAQLQFHGDFDGADKQESSHLWVLASPRNSDPSKTYPSDIRLPPVSVTGPMFRPVSRSGYGINLARFMWSRYTARPAPAYCEITTPRP
jgi:hypothetical protein